MTLKQALPLVCLALLLSPLAPAQQGPTPPPGQQHHDRSMMHPSGRDEGRDRMDHGSMGIVPPGTWWKNPDVIKDLSLTTDQQKHMDDIFRQDRIELIRMHASLEVEQVNLEPLLNANPPDSGKALAQISKIADIRASLEKANARMLLSLRSVLTADQWTKFHTHDGRGGDKQVNRMGGPRNGQDGRGRHGSDGPGGPNGNGGPGGTGGNLGNPPMPPPAA